MMSRTFIFIVTALLLSVGAADAQQEQSAAPFYAGFRASRVLSSYPNNQFPSSQYWVTAAKTFAAKFPGSTPAGIWIVSLYQSGGLTQLSFPSGGKTIPNVRFTTVDYNEAHLSVLDTAGVKVWLQVEPGAADMDTLISIVLQRYKHHPSVIGFGVDVEWFFANTDNGGRKMTDSMAARWEAKVRAVDSSYTLFVKHYGQSWMPPTYRSSILFVDDSQDFTFSATPFNTMVNEFKSWGAKFSPARSAFQYGYKADSVWWRNFADPMKTIGDALRSNIPSVSGLFWVDFTINKLIPITSVREGAFPLSSFDLLPVFPNPFNPAATLTYRLDTEREVTLRIVDGLGREAAVLVRGLRSSGDHSIIWDASGVAAGVYYAQLSSGGRTVVRKLNLVK